MQCVGRIIQIYFIEKQNKKPFDSFNNCLLQEISKYIIPNVVQTNAFHPNGQTEEQLWRHEFSLLAIM